MVEIKCFWWLMMEMKARNQWGCLCEMIKLNTKHFHQDSSKLARFVSPLFPLNKGHGFASKMDEDGVFWMSLVDLYLLGFILYLKSRLCHNTTNI